jgi:hypothetical protein
MRPLHLAAAALFLLLAWAPVATAGPQGCPAKTVSKDGVTVETHLDCTVVITEKLYDCVWGGHYVSNTVGKVTLRHYECYSPGPPPQ